MKKEIRIVFLVVALGLIFGAIWYLESQKAQPASPPGEVMELSAPSVRAPLASEGTASGTANATLTKQVAPRAVVKNLPRAKEIIKPSGFINSEPFKLADLVGKKVILIDFWTYSCINCQRTTPYLNAWYEKYKDTGFEIVGVHTPEFEFEKNYENVRAAVEKFDIKYPVVLDNDYATWSAYGNRYWPRKYLIDIDGYIVYDHIGEGAYAEAEGKIKEALAERASVLRETANFGAGTVVPSSSIDVNFVKVGSPETYFGASRNTNLGSGTPGVFGTQTLTIPQIIEKNKLYLSGSWSFNEQFAENQSEGAKIVFRYYAKNVYFVAGATSPVKITVLRDGVPLMSAKGGDITNEKGASTAIIHENRLYRLIEDADYGEHTFEIRIDTPGVQAFTFTFG